MAPRLLLFKVRAGRIPGTPEERREVIMRVIGFILSLAIVPVNAFSAGMVASGHTTNRARGCDLEVKKLKELRQEQKNSSSVPASKANTIR